MAHVVRLLVPPPAAGNPSGDRCILGHGSRWRESVAGHWRAACWCDGAVGRSAQGNPRQRGAEAEAAQPAALKRSWLAPNSRAWYPTQVGRYAPISDYHASEDLDRNLSTFPRMRKEKDNLWLAVKILLGLPLLFYALLSVFEPQREIWRKPTKKVLVAFLIAWRAVVCFVLLVFGWNAHR